MLHFGIMIRLGNQQNKEKLTEAAALSYAALAKGQTFYRNFFTIDRNPRSQLMMPAFGNSIARNCLATIFLIASLLSSPAAADNDLLASAAFKPGEKIVYGATWGPVKAGEMVMEVLPMETIQGAKACHFAMTTRTNEYVDLIYKVRERQESYVDIGMTHSLLYRKRAEGPHPRDVVVDFDWKKSQATRSNFGEKMSPVSIRQGTFDTLALFYIIRLHNLRQKDVIEIPISEGDNNILVKAVVGAREKIRIGDKAYDTVKVIPDMAGLESQQAVKKGDVADLTIWFSDDERKIPVRIQSKVKIGYFVFELTAEH